MQVKVHVLCLVHCKGRFTPSESKKYIKEKTTNIKDNYRFCSVWFGFKALFKYLTYACAFAFDAKNWFCVCIKCHEWVRTDAILNFDGDFEVYAGVTCEQGITTKPVYLERRELEVFHHSLQGFGLRCILHVVQSVNRQIHHSHFVCTAWGRNKTLSDNSQYHPWPVNFVFGKVGF